MYEINSSMDTVKEKIITCELITKEIIQKQYKTLESSVKKMRKIH